MVWPMPKPESKLCSACRFWEGSGRWVRRCHRYPPVGGLKTNWDDWCGEFQPRPRKRGESRVVAVQEEG